VIGSLLGLKNAGYWQDREVYDWYYTIAVNSEYGDIFTLNDPLFYLIIKIWDDNGFTEECLWIFLSAISLPLTVVSLVKVAQNKVVLFGTYFCFVIWVQLYTQVRMALALSLLLFGYYIAKNNKLLLAFLLIIACLIHISMLILVVPALVLAKIEFKRKSIAFWAISISLLVLIFSRLILPIFPVDKVVVYYELLSAGQYTRINIFSALPAIQLFTLLYIVYKKDLEGTLQTLEFKISLLGTLSFYALSAVPVFSVRVNELCSIFFIIILTNNYQRNLIFSLLWIVYVAFSLKSTYFLLIGPLAE
jgi:hypothetical protein